MKNLSIFPLHAYWVKYLGLIIAVAGGLLLLLGSTLLPEGYLRLLAVTGLYLVAGSRQKTETPRVQALRYVSFKAAFLYLVGVMIAVAFVDTLYGTGPQAYLLLAFSALLFHLALFHTLLRFGPETVEDSASLLENIRANRRFYRSAIIALLVIIAAVAFLAKQ